MSRDEFGRLLETGMTRSSLVNSLVLFPGGAHRIDVSPLSRTHTHTKIPEYEAPLGATNCLKFQAGKLNRQTRVRRAFVFVLLFVSRTGGRGQVGDLTPDLVSRSASGSALEVGRQ